jgi:hypothetical protein
MKRVRFNQSKNTVVFIPSRAEELNALMAYEEEEKMALSRNNKGIDANYVAELIRQNPDLNSNQIGRLIRDAPKANRKNNRKKVQRIMDENPDMDSEEIGMLLRLR